MIDDVNSWESAIVPTEKEKKEFARQRITSELEGNPNLPKKKTRKTRFAPPSEEDKKRMQYLDSLGNPLAGYAWRGMSIIEIATNKVVYAHMIKGFDPCEKQAVIVTNPTIMKAIRKSKKL